MRKKLRLHLCEICKLTFESTRDAQVQILASVAEQSVVGGGPSDIEPIGPAEIARICLTLRA